MGLNSRYEIRVKGILDGRWAAWFEDLQVTSDGTPPRSRLTTARRPPPGRPRRKHHEEIMHPVIRESTHSSQNLRKRESRNARAVVDV
jgi:hypothetical protein